MSLEPLCHGKRLADGESITGPVTLYIFPELKTTSTPHAGDTVNVDFFADEQKLCSQKAVWQDERRPAHRPGQAVPLWIAPAQWLVSDCIWSNVPPGSHTLMARAAGLNGLSAASAPIRFTVGPSTSP